MKSIFKILISIFSVILLSCESPYDIDTPRKKILPKPMDSVQLTLKEICVETNGTTERFKVDMALFELDTVSSSPLIWGTLSSQSTKVINFNEDKMHLYYFKMELVNQFVVGNTDVLGSNTSGGSYAMFSINRGVSSKFDTTIYSGSMDNKTEITFSPDWEKNELWVYLDSWISGYKVSMNNDSSDIFSYEPDIIFFKCKLHFCY
jgi:hypothetical protein